MKQILSTLFAFGLTALCTPSFAQFTAIELTSDFGYQPMYNWDYGDFDGDGDIDVVALNGLEVFVIFNMSDLTFSTPQLIETLSLSPDFGIELKSIDLEGDGLTDIALLAYFSGTPNQLHVIRQTNPAVFSGAELVAEDVAYFDKGDIDTDGVEELLIIVNDVSQTLCAIDMGILMSMEYLGGGLFSEPDTIYYSCTNNYEPNTLNEYFTQELHLADITGDDINDLVGVFGDMFSFIGIGIMDGALLPAFDSADPQQISGGTSRDFELADIDNDGDLDAVNEYSPRTYKNTGGILALNQFGAEIWSSYNPAISLSDINGDGFKDLLKSGEVMDVNTMESYTGIFVYYNDGEGNFTGLENDQYIPPMVYENQFLASRIETIDFNNDGMDEYLGYMYDDGDHLTVLTTEGVDIIYGNVFYDENFSEWYDSADIPLQNQPVLFDNSTYYYTDANGAYSIPAGNGTHTLLADFDQSLWVYTTSPTYVTEVVDGNAAFNNLPFGRMPIGSVNLLSATITKISGTCNETATHEIHITNTGNSTTQGTITLNLDPLFGFTDSNMDELSISGNTISWNYEGLWPTHSFSIEFYGLAPDENSAGQEVMHSVVVTAEDDLGNILNTFTADETYILECSYDPNDKTTNTGYTESGFVLANTELDYTIRFQNTGNAPATNVRVEDQLSELLQWNTLAPIAWSHDFDLMIDETGRAIFNFENIMLPDSVSDEPNSHGFVRFTIMQDGNLLAGTEIENTAEIFFDLNEPFITDTTLNTIYDCVDLEQAVVSATEVCVGEEINCTNEAVWIVGLAWYFNDEYAAAGSFDYTVEQSGLLTMQASNNLCAFQQEWNITALDFEAIISVGFCDLTASEGVLYQWYLDGEILPGATIQTINLLEVGAGYYTVLVTDANGCTDMSEGDFYSCVGVSEISSSGFEIWPNPVTDFFTICFSSFNTGGEFVVMDAMGRVVMKEKITAKEMKVNAGSWASGVYEIRLDANSIKVVVEQ